jgi:polyisoprenoid-binding protein YceI
MSTIETTRQALPTGTWNADPVHSHVGFAVEYVGGTFRGTFSPFDATLAVTENGATLTGSAPVAGVKVQDDNLTAHLQSPDFFDAERAPELRFESTEIRRDGGRLEVDGLITIRGETQPVHLAGTITDPADDPFGGVRFQLVLEGTLDRTQFGLNWNNPLPSGEPSLANDVTLRAELFFVKA